MRRSSFLVLAWLLLPISAQARSRCTVEEIEGTVLAIGSCGDDGRALARVRSTMPLEDREVEIAVDCGVAAALRVSDWLRVERSGRRVRILQRVPVQGLGLDVRGLLGATRESIERTLVPTEEEPGLVRYERLAIRYEAGVAVELVIPLPAAISCADVPAWLGLPADPGAAPLRRRDGCAWPGISERHRLAPGLAATLRGGVLRIVRVGHTPPG